MLHKLNNGMFRLQERQFVFLLSSKAGGCGINLVGGNRLILFDPDWCAGVSSLLVLFECHARHLPTCRRHLWHNLAGCAVQESSE